MKITRIAVAGTGLMGPGIAAAAALGGFDATLVSRRKETAERGVEEARRQIRWLGENGLAETAEVGPALSRITPSDDPVETVRNVDLFVESILEDLSLKREYFAMLDRASEGAILCSNTSGISITEIAEGCSRPERVFTTHFWNPPHLMPLVEVIIGAHSDTGLVESIISFLRQCGKTPVLVRKDRPGQLGNRIQHAMIRECINIVAEGIASPEDVDLAVKAGFGLRTPVYGVFEHADMVGLDLVKSIQDYVNSDLSGAQEALPVHTAKVEAGELGVKTGKGFLEWPQGRPEEVRRRRDDFILEFLRMKRQGRFD